MGDSVQAAQAGGFMGFLRRMFGMGPSVPAAAARKSASRAGQAGGAKAAAAPSRELTFADYASALSLEVLEPTPLADEWAEQLQPMAARVLEHVTKNKGGPTSLPTASLKVLNLVAQPDVETAELTRAASQDPAIAAAVLRAANSALSAVASEVKTVREAVTRLGVTEVGRVAGAVAARALFSPRAKAELNLFPHHWAQLHLCAATSASGAAYLAMQRRKGRSDLAFLGGMLHDVGKSVALGSISTLALAGELPRDLPDELVRAVLEKVHVEIGGEVHVDWSLPQYLVTLCASHHDAFVPVEPEFTEVHLVRVVSGLLSLRFGPQTSERIAELMQSLQVLALSPLDVRALDTELKTMSEHLQSMLGISLHPPAPAAAARASTPQQAKGAA